MKFDPEIAMTVIRKSIEATGPIVLRDASEVDHARLMADCWMIEGYYTKLISGSGYYVVERATAKAHAATLWAEVPKDIQGFM